MSAINVWNRNTERVADRLSRDSEKVTVHCPIRNMLRVGQDADRQALTLLRNDSNRLSPKRRTSVGRNPGIQENVRVPNDFRLLVYRSAASQQNYRPLDLPNAPRGPHFERWLSSEKAGPVRRYAELRPRSGRRRSVCRTVHGPRSVPAQFRPGSAGGPG